MIKIQEQPKEMDLTQLPPDVIESEILPRLSLPDTVRLLASSKSMREQYYQGERRREIKQEKVKAQLLDLAYEEFMENRNRDVGYLKRANPELSALLGPTFPRFRTNALVSNQALVAWLKVYAVLNGLRIDNVNMRLDPLMQRLGDLKTERKHVSTYSSLASNILKEQAYSNDVPSLAEMDIINYIKAYLHQLYKYLSKIDSMESVSFLTKRVSQD